MKTEIEVMRKMDVQIISKLFFRLLPVQILLCLIGVVNSVVSSLFAGNFVGELALGAVGLYGPVSMFVGAVRAGCFRALPHWLARDALYICERNDDHRVF